MEEKVYKRLKVSGIWSLVLGIISIIAGVSMGIMLIIGGTQLLKDKKNILF